MAEETKIVCKSSEGLLRERLICVPTDSYVLENDNRYLIPFTEYERFGFLDRQGNVVVNAKFDVIYDTAMSEEDFIRVGRFYYINYYNKRVDASTYRYSRIGVINTKGKLIVPMGYEGVILPYKSNALFVAKIEKGEYCVIGINGQEIVPSGKYKYIDGFTNGCARVRNADNLWGIIDEFGNEVLPCEYPKVWNFYRKDYPNAILEKNGHLLRFNFKTKEIVLPLSCTKSDKRHTIVNLEKDSYGTHYGEFAGSYAQDVMGYSDDVINDAFEGDPEAYWNID